MSDTLLLRAARVLSGVSPAVLTSQVQGRANRYGEARMEPVFSGKSHPHADEGAYFSAVTPTALTGIDAAIATAYAATTPYLFLKNVDAAGATAKRIYLDYIKLLCTVAPASGTALHVAGEVDDSTTRYTSGGTALTPVCPNMDETAGSGDTLYVGAITAAAAGANRRMVFRDVLDAQIPVVKSVYVIDFGGAQKGSTALGVITSAKRVVVSAPPVIIGPQQSFLLNLFSPSNSATAGQYEVEIGYSKR